MSKYFSFSQSEAKNFLACSKTASKIPGLKLVVEGKKAATSPSADEDNQNQAAKKKADHGKLLIVIPRRVAKATGRNLIRRRIKAIYYEQELFKNTNQYAVFVYPEAKDFSYTELAAFLKKSL